MAMNFQQALDAIKAGTFNNPDVADALLHQQNTDIVAYDTAMAGLKGSHSAEHAAFEAHHTANANYFGDAATRLAGGGPAGGGGNPKDTLDLRGKAYPDEKKVNKKFKEMKLDEFATHFDADGSPHDAVKFVESKQGNKVELKRSSDLGKLKSDIDRLHTEKTRLQERDPSSKRIGEIDKQLERMGKAAQKELHLAHEENERFLKSLRKQVDEKKYKWEDKRSEMTSAIDSIEVDGKKGSRKFTIEDELAKELQVKTAQGEYKITTDGQIEAITGQDVQTLSRDHIDDIKKKAKTRVNEHFDARIEAVENRFKEHETHLTQGQDLLKKELASEISTKTGAGEFVSGKSSKVTPGGALAVEKGVIGVEAYKGKSFFGKMGAEVNANFKSGPMGVVQVLAGGLLGLDTLRRAYKGFTAIMSSDPEKQAEGGWNDIAVAGLEGTGAYLLATMGGRARATGQSFHTAG